MSPTEFTCLENMGSMGDLPSTQRSRSPCNTNIHHCFTSTKNCGDFGPLEIGNIDKKISKNWQTKASIKKYKINWPPGCRTIDDGVYC
jgi:hypothetical protein